jgi:Domain of unknown function (DUF4129)
MDKFQKTNWLWQLEQIQQRLGEWIEVKLKFAAPRGGGIPAWLVSSISYLLWFLLIAGIVWIIYLILNRYGQQFGHRRPAQEPAPQPVRNYTVTELLAQAQQFQNQRNYSEACRCLYLAMLQRLNDANLVPHQTSRTDREYAELLGHLPKVALIVAQSKVLLQTHEQLQFADRTITADGFNSCQQAYNQLDTQLQQQAGQNS